MPLDFPIYMDNHSTTRVDPRVLDAMLPYFSEKFGNAGSVNHRYGWDARDAVNAARESIASNIGAQAREIVFTSGATESNNLALFGAVDRTRLKDPARAIHLISVATEHKAILDPLAALQQQGCEVTLLSVAQAGQTDAGRISAEQIEAAIRPETLLVSVMAANNEIGVVQPIAEIGAVCRARGILFHCDATQAVGMLPIDVDELNVDLMSFSAHKIYGPKGVGSLFIRRRSPVVKLEPQIYGGGQENGFRSGTANVPGIVGFARALELGVEELPQETTRLAGLRNRLFDKLTSELSDVTLNGPTLDQPGWRLPNNLNLSFGYVEGQAILLDIQDSLAVSSGSACTSANPEPSHVLRALGLSEDAARSSLRFGLGRFNTQEEVDAAAEIIIDSVKRLRKLSSMA